MFTTALMVFTWFVVPTLLIAAIVIRAIKERRRLHKTTDTLPANTPVQQVPLPKDKAEVIPLSTTRVKFGCGHEGPENFCINVYGRRLDPSEEIRKNRLDCPDCVLPTILAMSVRCAICGQAIGPGDPIATYTNGPFKPEWTKRLPDGRAVGCLNNDCCPDGSYFTGHWNGEGMDPAFPEGRSALQHTFAGMGPDKQAMLVNIGQGGKPTTVDYIEKKPPTDKDGK